MKKTKLRSSGKNLVLLFTLIAVVAFVPHSFAKGKKRGTRLLIQKQDGQIFKTELLAVKGSKLILMDTRLSSEITVNIQELKSIQIIKKSKILQGIGIGLLIGGTAGALFGSSGGNTFSGGWGTCPPEGQAAPLGTLGFALLAAPIGGIVGGLMGIDEKIVLDGKSPEEIEHILKKLNSKSRFPVKSLQRIKKTNSKAKKEA